MGYKSTVPVFSSLGGGSVISLNVEVTGTETVTVPAGTYPCYRLDLHIGQVFWISTNAARDIVKIEGGGVVMELTGVRHRNASDPVNYVDADGFSLTAPPGWVIGSLAQEKTKASVLLLDPALTGTCVLDWSALETIEPKTATNSVAPSSKKKPPTGPSSIKTSRFAPIAGRSGSWRDNRP